MANKIEEIALKHKLCRFVPGDDGYGGEDEAYPNAMAALRELLEECCKEVNAVKQRQAVSRDRALNAGRGAVSECRQAGVETCDELLARLRALGGE